MAEYDFLNTNSYKLFRDKYLSENSGVDANPPGEGGLNASTKSLMERMVSEPGVFDKILSNNNFDPNKYLGSSNAPQSSFGSNFLSNNFGQNYNSLNTPYNSNNFFSNSFGASYNPNYNPLNINNYKSNNAGGNTLTAFGAGSDTPTAFGNVSRTLSQESEARKARLYDTSDVKTSNVGTYAQIANVAGSVMQSVGRANQAKNTPEGYYDSRENTADAINQGVDMAKDTVASFLGPFGMLFRGIQKLGEGAGNAIGGEVGGHISGVFSPESGTIYGLTNKDYSFGEKLLSTIPGLGGAMMARDKQKKRMKYESDKYFENINKLETEREKEQRLMSDRNEINRLKTLRAAQLGYIQNENNYG